MTGQKTYGAKQIASRIGTDPKTLRKFLRSEASPYESVGQGGRYEFPVEDLAEIKSAFIGWQKKKRAPDVHTKRPARPSSSQKTPSDMEIIDEALDETEPTPEELAEIDDEGLEID